MSPPPTSVLILHNPRACRVGARAPQALADALVRRGVAARVIATESAADAARAVEADAQQSDAPAQVLASAGGDGTARAVAALAHARGLALAVAPWGVGNYLASELGLPAAPDRLAGVIAAGRRAPLALARANGEAFVLMAGAGLDAAAVAAIPAGLKALNGSAAYAAALIREFTMWRGRALAVTLDGRQESCTWFVATNARFRDKRLVLSEDARPRLHALLINADDPLARADMVRRFALRELSPARALRITAFERAVVSGPAGAPVQLDGDAAGALPVEIVCDPRPLEAIIPAR